MSLKSVECVVAPMVIRRGGNHVYTHWNSDLKYWVRKDQATKFASPSKAHAYYEKVLHGRYVGICFVEPAA